jgi:hypothetical protein
MSSKAHEVALVALQSIHNAFRFIAAELFGHALCGAIPIHHLKEVLLQMCPSIIFRRLPSKP